MFQTAAAIAYAKKHGFTWLCPNDTRENPRVYEWFPNLPRGDWWGGQLYHAHDPSMFHYIEIPHYPDGARLLGFFQSPKFFENAQDEVRAAFPLLYIPGLQNAIGLHIRRGDYVEHSNSFPPVTKEYVYLALKEFLNSALRRVVVCSDDIQWCKDTFGDRGHIGDEIFTFEYSTGLSEFTDLCALASCHSNIIANSTFSYWAAWLNSNPDKMVVSPHHLNWFGSGNPGADTRDLLPPEWIQIKFR